MSNGFEGSKSVTENGELKMSYVMVLAFTKAKQ